MATAIDEEALIDLLTGRRDGSVIIGYLTRQQQHAIGSLSAIVWLSRFTLHKFESRRRGTDFKLYRLVPAILEAGEARQLSERHLVFLWSSLSDTTRPYRAVVKTTRLRHENYLDSAYRIQVSQVRKTIAESKPLRGK